jgi:nitrate reductase cytochrome c-type subunit
MKAGNIKELESELEELYILIGETNGEQEQSVYDRVNELERIINPPLIDYSVKDYNCHCHRSDCWECVYKDDPMGI